MACLAITGGLRATLTATMKVFLDLPLLDTLVRMEARMALHRLKQLDHRPIFNKIMEGDLLIRMILFSK